MMRSNKSASERLLPTVRRIVLCLFLSLFVVIFGLFLLAIPKFHNNSGLPLFPSLIAAEALLIAMSLCFYILNKILFLPLRNQARLSFARGRNRSTPWLENSQWANRRITHSNAGKVILLWLFVFNWWGAIWFFAQDRGVELLKQSLAIKLFSLIFILMGLLMLIFAIRNTLNWIRFNRSALLIETLPGRPGSPFRGTFELGFRPKYNAAVLVHFTAFIRHWRHLEHVDAARKLRGMQDEEPFHDVKVRIKTAGIQKAGEHFYVPVAMTIPRGSPSSGGFGEDSEVIWRLALYARTRHGAKFHAQFDIPVFNLNGR